MKHYVTLENCLGSKLKVKELFVYAIMKSSTNELSMTDITIEQISQWAIIPVKTIECSILPKLKELNVFKIETFWSKGLKRNSYTFTQPVENFRFIEKDFLFNTTFTPSQKGFMIALYMQSFNNSLLCGLPYNEIIRRLNLSNKTFYKYLNELIALGSIVIIDPNKQNFEDILIELDLSEYNHLNNSLYLKFFKNNFFQKIQKL